MIGHPHDHPFWGCNIEDINEYDQQKLESKLKLVVSVFNEISKYINSLSKSINIELLNFSTVISYCQLISVLSENHQIPDSLIRIVDVEKFASDLTPVLNDIQNFQNENSKLLEKYHNKIYEEDIAVVLNKFEASYDSFWRIFSPNYYKTKKKISQHLIRKQSLSYSNLLSDTKKIFRVIELKERIHSTKSQITEPLATLWNDTDTNVNLVSITINWLKKYFEKRIAITDNDILTKYILNSLNLPKELVEQKNLIERTLNEFKIQVNLVLKSLEVDARLVFPEQIANTSLDRLDRIFNSWKNNIHLLVDWTRYQKSVKICKKMGIESFLHEMYSDKVKFDEYIPQFKKSYLYHLFQLILKENPILRDFEALNQNRRIEKFQELDQVQFQIAKLRLLANLFENKPDSAWEGSKSSQLGYLQRQFRLKRGHHPIRKILANVPTIVQQLCPCFMMR